MGFLLSAVLVIAFVWMLRRAGRRQAELFKQEQEAHSATPWDGLKPKPLSQAQRKALKLEPSKTGSPDVKPSDMGLRPGKKPRYGACGPQQQTRAIRQGWSLGTVQFTYEDEDGDITFRTVTVHHVTRTRLKGECHMRRAERTFRFDRIIGTLTDCDTGEILTPEECSSRFGL